MSVNIARVNLMRSFGRLDFAPTGWHERRPIEGDAMLTVHHLNNSRSQRVLWLLEELEVPYEIVRYQRQPDMRAPKELRAIHPLGKSPVITDNGNTIAESGAIIEYYSDPLTPLPGRAGRIVEPGHCFEWAWLFEKLTSRGSLGGESFADRLVAFARRNGLDERRGVVLNELLIDGSTADGRARLWPQTERLRASAARYVRLGTNEEAVDAIAAAESLVGYLQVPVRGLWRDKLKEDGEWVEELAPGSSLYHIVGAISELVRATPSSPVLVRA